MRTAFGARRGEVAVKDMSLVMEFEMEGDVRVTEEGDLLVDRYGFLMNVCTVTRNGRVYVKQFRLPKNTTEYFANE